MELRLRNNQIGSLKGFAAAPNLLYLDLSFNKINSLKGLENIAQMKTLQLANNEISGGLRAFTFMKALVDLSLANNPVARKGGLPGCIANTADYRGLMGETLRDKALKRGDAGVYRSGTSPEGAPKDDNLKYAGRSPGTLSQSSPVMRSHEMLLRSKGSPGYSLMHDRATRRARKAEQDYIEAPIQVSPSHDPPGRRG